MEQIKVTKTTEILTNKYFQLTLLYIIAFTIPFLLKGPQLLVGSSINFLLILSISQFKFKEILPALFLPSISSFIYGTLFGGATNFLLYLIPIIVIANGIYVYTYKNFKYNHLNIIVASILKASFLFICVYILFKLSILPQIFLTTMGIIQLTTALIGGITAHSLIALSKKI